MWKGFAIQKHKNGDGMILCNRLATSKKKKRGGGVCIRIFPKMFIIFYSNLINSSISYHEIHLLNNGIIDTSEIISTYIKTHKIRPHSLMQYCINALNKLAMSLC